MGKYGTVNDQWPEGSNDGRDLKPTPQEAVSAAKRLYRFGMGRAFTGTIKLTSGNRYTWIRRGVLHVNPDYNGGGWHELVHLMSHYCANRKFPQAKGHGPQHAYMEKEMIRYAVQSGWLDGKLRRPEKTKPSKDEVQQQKLVKLETQIKRWESKKKRAETALRKLGGKRQRLERNLELSAA